MQRGEVRRRPGRSWEARWREGDGTRRSKGGFRTKADAALWISDRVRQVQMGRLYRPRLTLADFLDEFEAQYDASSASIERMKYALVKARSGLGSTLLSDLSGPQIALWRKTFVSPHTRWEATRSLKQALAVAVRWRYLDENPVAISGKNKRPPSEEFVPFESWHEIDAIAAELSQPYRAIPIFMTGTGLRPGEWRALRRRDIDLDARTIAVRRAEKVGGEIGTTKTNEGRLVPLRKKVIDALAPILPPRPNDLVFRAPGGGMIEDHNFRSREWKPALEAAGLEHRPPYAMRHTYAAWGLRAGVNTFALARRMGTSLEMIERTYGHLTNDAVDWELGLMDEFDGSYASRASSSARSMSDLALTGAQI